MALNRRSVAAIATTAAAVALAIAVGGRSCSGGDGSPSGAARAFVAAAQDGDKQGVWDLLGPMTRQRLEASAQGASEKVGGSQRFTPLDVLEVSARDSGRTPVEAILKERSGDTAVVELVSPSGERDGLRLVKVGKRWLVELDVE